jgi:Xaa-Pro aminopeptidase
MSRLDNIKKVLDEGINNETLDGILITAPINQYYLTEFRLDDGYVLVTRGKSYVFADSRYIEAAKMQIKSDYEIVLLRGKQTDYLGSVLDGENVKKLGFEDTSITFAAYQTLKNNFPGIELKPVGNILEKLRERKDASEIDKITKAQKITDDAFRHI